MIGAFATVGYPGYWLVWTEIFPQQYENLPLRIFCVCLSLPLLAWPYLSERRRQKLDIYLMASAVFNLPFFFTFMTLMNNANSAWQMSLVSSVIFMALLVDPIRLVLLHVVGTLLALAAFEVIRPNAEVPPGLVATFPVQVFALAGGALFNASWAMDRLERNRLKSVAAVGASFAHEVRTPLLSIELDAAGLRERVGAADRVPPAPAEEIAALDRILQQTRGTSRSIDLLLANAGLPRSQPEELTVQSMAMTVAEAVDQYPFRGGERNLVQVERTTDFAYRGNPGLMRYVLFNLIKNSLHAVAQAGGGRIVIRLERARASNRLIVEDSGVGIPKSVLPFVAEPFFTTRPVGVGTGLGIAFCRRTLSSFGAGITFESESGAGTRAILTFPFVAADTAAP